MRILLISTSYNSLTQIIHAQLRDKGHDVAVTLSLSDQHMRNAVALVDPELIICPYLKERLPAIIYTAHTSIIIHPGIIGDRGSSSLDWAILEGEKEWGVTALEATEEFDAGRIWATRTFPLRRASKTSIYRNEVAQAATAIVDEVIDKFASRTYQPLSAEEFNCPKKGVLRNRTTQEDRKIDWNKDNTEAILQKMRSAESSPGILDTLEDDEYYLFGMHKEDALRGETPGELIGKRGKAVLRATIDGAVWITHMKKRGQKTIKLPATIALGRKAEILHNYPHPSIFETIQNSTWRDIWYKEENLIGYLYFDFYNGAMGIDECLRLTEALRMIKNREIKALILLGGEEYFSNGIYLHEIEASADPAEKSWENINAMDDVVKEILSFEDKIIISALRGSAGAGGAIMALAGDYVFARDGVILNPHYRAMGLYGSEYWTYLLPRRVGKRKAIEITHVALPLSSREAKNIGLIDDILSSHRDDFMKELSEKTQEIVFSENFPTLIEEKKRKRQHDESTKALESYREEELIQMKKNFAGHSFGGYNYHKYRQRFVFKERVEKIPPNLL